MGAIATRWIASPAALLRVWRRRAELDRSLALGASPVTGDLAVRAGQLTGGESRDRLACALEAALLVARREPAARSVSDSEFDREEILAATPAIEALIERLRDRAPVSAHGVAVVSMLVCDPASPLFGGAPNDALYRAARTAKQELDGTGRPGKLAIGDGPRTD